MMTARDRFIVSVAISYAVLALAWIFLSDQLLSLFADINSMVWLSSVKGVFFVIASTAAFLLALRAVPPVTGNGGASHPLLETLAHGISPSRLPAWLTYSFAVVVTAAMLLVRDQLALGFGERPLLILFVLPIFFSALFGGLWPGLLSTAIAALGVDYLAIPPVRSLFISTGHDLLQWAFLILTGVVVSVLSEALRRSLSKAEVNRRLLDAVISGTPDAVFVKDAQGRYLLANAATAGFIGRPVNDILGRDDTTLFPAESANKVMALDREILAAGRTQTHEERLTTQNGQALVFLVSKGPVFDGQGRIVGLFGISREITDRKRAENEIRRLNAALEQRVAERSAELQSANIELEELAYALTHNLRAPLRAIDSFTRLLVDGHTRNLDAEAIAYLDQITQANSSMGALIEGILALLRCTRGALRREKVDVSALARTCLDDLAAGEPQRKVTCEVEAGLTVSADAAMLELAMKHLVDNAWKFTRGVDNPLVRVYSGEADGSAVICVADNGAGFDMAHAQRLFRPFQRLHRHDEFPGIGIGLATVQRIIQRHGGNIRADAAPGVGATFCFSLPQTNRSTRGSP